VDAVTGGRALPGNRWDLLDGVDPARPPSVSVIVAHYDQAAQLARTLHALSQQDHPAERMQIIVADDGSPHPPDLPVGVELVRHADEGFRLAAVRNLGAARARGDVLVFLDADTAPEPGFVRALARLPALAPDVVAVGRRRHADFAGVAVDAPPGAARILAEPAWLAEGYRVTGDLLQADDRSYRYLIGAVLACSRDLFERVGGFDESFTAYGGEDWEWGYRAWLAGAVLAHVPSAVAWHDGPDAGARDRAGAARAAETMRLADLIPVPGSRPRGIRPSFADMIVHAPASATAAQAFVSVDSALAALPGADAADDTRARQGRARIHVELLHPVRVRGNVLRDAVDRVTREALGDLTLTVDGRPAIRISAARALARRARWRDQELFPSVTAEAGEGLVSLHAEPDVEAYLGGWG
jgi:GT2 family glycosyltransferase